MHGIHAVPAITMDIHILPILCNEYLIGSAYFQFSTKSTSPQFSKIDSTSSLDTSATVLALGRCEPV